MACIIGSRSAQGQPAFTVRSQTNFMIPSQNVDSFVNSLTDPSKALAVLKRMQAVDKLTGSFPGQCYEIGTQPKWSN